MTQSKPGVSNSPKSTNIAVDLPELDPLGGIRDIVFSFIGAAIGAGFDAISQGAKDREPYNSMSGPARKQAVKYATRIRDLSTFIDIDEKNLADTQDPKRRKFLSERIDQRRAELSETAFFLADVIEDDMENIRRNSYDKRTQGVEEAQRAITTLRETAPQYRNRRYPIYPLKEAQKDSKPSAYPEGASATKDINLKATQDPAGAFAAFILSDKSANPQDLLDEFFDRPGSANLTEAQKEEFTKRVEQALNKIQQKSVEKDFSL